MEFLVLTAARAGEVFGVTWGEIGFENKLWIIPADRMKAGRQHRVPLSDRAVAILRHVEPLREEGPLRGAVPQTAYIFPGSQHGRPLSNMALTQLMRRMEAGDYIPTAPVPRFAMVR